MEAERLAGPPRLRWRLEQPLGSKFESSSVTITHELFLEIEGQLQNMEGVVPVRAKKIRALGPSAFIRTQSYDFSYTSVRF